jgi:ABC-type thiamin/hydroxymethylpyrimidine transport system permease subunit
LIEGPFSPFGWIILLLQIAVGICSEVPFVLTGYQVFNLFFLCGVGAIGNLGTVLVSYALNHLGSLTLAAQATSIVASLLGGLLGGLIAALLSNVLAKAGVLSSYEIGRKSMKEV